MKIELEAIPQQDSGLFHWLVENIGVLEKLSWGTWSPTLSSVNLLTRPLYLLHIRQA